MKSFIITFSALAFWFVFIGYTVDTGLKLPEKKISRTIQKLWKVEEYKMVLDESVSCNDYGAWYKIESDGGTIIGSFYIGRVNSCRSGGCSVETEDALSYEYFDYLLFTDLIGEVLKVKIFNYRATQGHEVMSRGWLNQFKGMVPGKKLNFGKEIDAISGATISASALTTDIQEVLSCAF